MYDGGPPQPDIFLFGIRAACTEYRCKNEVLDKNSTEVTEWGSYQMKNVTGKIFEGRFLAIHIE